MFDKIKIWVFTVGIKSLVRKLMVFISGVLIGTIGVDPAVVEKFTSNGGAGEVIATAIILYVIAQVWSYKDKVKEVRPYK